MIINLFYSWKCGFSYYFSRHIDVKSTPGVLKIPSSVAITCIDQIIAKLVNCLDNSPRNENLNLLVQIKFLNLFYIYIYIYLNKNWKIYWSEWSFTCLGQGDWCSSWGLGNFLLITILHDVKQMHTCTVYRVRVWLGVWKESFNCDGPQFHKTNNHLSPHLKHKNPQHITLEIHVLSWERHKNVEGLNLIMGLQSTLSSWSLDNWISNISICIFTNDKKNLHRFTSTQKDHKKSLYNQPKPYFFKKNIVKWFLDRF